MNDSFEFFWKTSLSVNIQMKAIEQFSQMASQIFPGGDSHMKVTGMLVVSLRVVNCRFWSHLGC